MTAHEFLDQVAMTELTEIPPAIMPRESTQDPVPVTGCWLRTQGGRVQVLLEVAGVWRLVNDEPLHDGEKTIIGHITEPIGILSRPIDPLYELAEEERP